MGDGSMVIFLRLDEIKMPSNLQLPDYTEIIDLVPMEEDLNKPYMEYIQKIIKEIRKDKRLLGNLATDAISIPDMPFTAKSAQDKIFYEPETTREAFGITAKEQRLIDNVKKELDEGRNCMVYLTFTNQTVATDITTILSEAFPAKKVKFLPSTVQPTKRKEWIEKNPCDVLIANPELVKTGLTLLQFPTIIFYQITYNVFTLKQASRRSWRIGQSQAVKVIFMAYKDTPQHIALKLIGAKVSAANSLEGRLSGDDDLSSMADEEDNIQLALAKAILSGKNATGDIATTSIKNFGANREFDNFELYYQGVLNKRDAKVAQAEIIEASIEIAPMVTVIENTLAPQEEIDTKEEARASFEGENFDNVWDEYIRGHMFASTQGFEHWIQTQASKPHDKTIVDTEQLVETIGNFEPTLIYYVGKGKKQKRVEVANSSENLLDLIPVEALKVGVQLSLF